MLNHIRSLLDHVIRGNLTVVLDNRRRLLADRPRRLLRRPPGIARMRGSARLINRLLRSIGGSKDLAYLEIGVQRGLTLEKVVAGTRVGVDPNPLFENGNLPRGLSVFVGTSDVFFENIGSAGCYDVVFVDGLHHAEQTYRDVVNALNVLRPGGVLLIDDTIPVDRWASLRDEAETHRQRRLHGLPCAGWQGDVWRILLALQAYHPDLDWRTIRGSGNAQTLLWRKESHQKVFEGLFFNEGMTDELAAYEHSFRSGWPIEARESSEDDAIMAWLAGRAISNLSGVKREPGFFTSTRMTVSRTR